MPTASPIRASGTLMRGQNSLPPVSPNAAATKNQIIGIKHPPGAVPKKA